MENLSGIEELNEKIIELYFSQNRIKYRKRYIGSTLIQRKIAADGFS